MKRTKILSVVAVLLALTLVGCQKQTPPASKHFNKKAEISSVSDLIAAENEHYRLEIDEVSKGVTLVSRITGRRYGTSPQPEGGLQVDEFGFPITLHPQAESVLFVEYVNTKTNAHDRVISFADSVGDDRVSCTKLDDGVRMEYYFDSVKIMVPVEYRLCEKGVRITINPDEIEEESNLVLTVSLAPYMCAVENTDKRGYLLYPSGSGALIYAKETSPAGSVYTAEVYGRDASMEQWDDVSNAKEIRLPVYGAKTENGAVMAVIEQGADSALLTASVGATSIKYSSVYAGFRLRGYTDNIKELYNDRYYEGMVYSEGKIRTPLTVGLYPIEEQTPDYSGMAALYRQILAENAPVSEKCEPSELDITVVGGTMIPKSFLGVPYHTVFPATTLKKTGEILSDLTGAGAKITHVELKGFGTSGVDIGKLAGNFTVSPKLGKVSQLKNVKALCDENRSDLFFDFDLTSFRERTRGYSTYSDSARRANHKTAKQYRFDLATLSRDTDESAFLLARDRFADTVDRLLKKTSSWNLSGFGLNDLGSTSYGDYSSKTDPAFYAKAGMAEQVTALLERVKKSGHRVLCSDANAYAAAAADAVFAVPTVSADALVFDADVPFYSMVFRGRTALSSESINLMQDPDIGMLHAVESGCGLAYTVIGDYSNVLLDSHYGLFYNSLYKDLREDILSRTSELRAYYAAVGDAAIERHAILTSGLRETVFSNKTAVYVNYTDEVLTSPIGAVEPLSFRVGEAAS